jgi:DamX protein
VIEPEVGGAEAAESAQSEPAAAEPAVAAAVRGAAGEGSEPAGPGLQPAAGSARAEAAGTTDAAERSVATPAAAAVEAPAAAKPPAAASAPDSGTSGVRDSRWLLRQNPDYFTLQLITVSALDRAQAFVAKQKQPGEFAIYQLQREGRVLHVVIYGLYSSRDAAQQAADHLPAEAGDVRPWIRRIGQVQDAARISTLQ